MNKNKAFRVIILFGLVSLFGDLVYESARSVNGPYLKVLGANAAIVGLIAGVGEFLGYALRLLSGYFSDKTKSYWFFAFLGYAVLVSVPLLSVANVWQVAAAFIVIERIGKALRSPARDAILSHASAPLGTGFTFGLHEALDQVGAIIGPVIFTVLFVSLGTKEIGVTEYQKGYSLLWIPFLFLIASLFFAYILFPNPSEPKIQAKAEKSPDKLPKVFYYYNIFTFIATLGFVNFILIAYHFKTKNIFQDAQIPLLYAVAMGIDAVVALAIGKIYDMLKNKSNDNYKGLEILVVIPLFSLMLPILGFSKNPVLAVIGVCIWGVIMSIHETIMRSAIADITPFTRRGTAYGIFNTSYGMAIFLGTALMGLIYDYSIGLLIAASIVIEAIAIIVFFLMRSKITSERNYI